MCRCDGLVYSSVTLRQMGKARATLSHSYGKVGMVNGAVQIVEQFTKVKVQ